MTARQCVVAAERRVKAMEFRAAGLTFRQIGAQLGVSHTAARNYVVAGLRAARVELEKIGKGYVLLELERLESPVVELVKQLKSGQLSPTELCQVIDTIRKLSESRRKLLGLDAPTKVAPTTPDGEKAGSNVLIYIPENNRNDPAASGAADAVTAEGECT